eukprot:scaffold463491_cov41-Prasinocladus_malaysianus.AAC.1
MNAPQFGEENSIWKANGLWKSAELMLFANFRGSYSHLDAVYIQTVCPCYRMPLPEYEHKSPWRAGSANDVLAFGVVLLELLSGWPALYRVDENTILPANK